MSAAIFMVINALRHRGDEKKEDWKEKMEREQKKRLISLHWMKGGKDDE